MISKLQVAIVAAALVCVATPVLSDSYTPSHSCNKPYKPYRFDSDWQYQQFKNDVEDYKQCISDFVDEQNDEARNHAQAAEDAIEEWNRYVRYELD